jgi:aminoglycoside phosphotransferase (APT) family kinase protein
MTLEEALPIIASPHARPWQQEGWAKSVTTWLSTILPGEVRLEAAKVNDLACVLKLKTREGTVYFKTSHKGQEASVTARLAKIFPTFVPNVIAYHAEHNWLLTRDSGEWLSLSGHLDQWQTSLSVLATFHKTHSSVFEDLRLPVHSFADLANRGEAFLRDTAVLQTWDLLPEQLENLEQLIPSLHSACEHVRTLDLAESFTHGDAYPNNALVKEESLCWFDWSEAGFAHPFLDMGWFLAWTVLPRRDPPFLVTYDTTWQCWEHYLKARGTEGASVTPLEVMRLALLHRALAYHEKFYDWQGVISTTRPQYVSYFLKLLIKTSNLKNQYNQ